MDQWISRVHYTFRGLLFVENLSPHWNWKSNITKKGKQNLKTRTRYFEKRGFILNFYIKVNKIWIGAIFLTVPWLPGELSARNGSCRELLFWELISISFGYMRFRYVALQLSLLKVDYTEIMKRVLKNREKSLRSEKMNAKGKASSTVSWVLFGLINLQTCNSKKTRIMKLNRIFRLLIFPFRSPGELYN